MLCEKERQLKLKEQALLEQSEEKDRQLKLKEQLLLKKTQRSTEEIN